MKNLVAAAALLFGMVAMAQTDSKPMRNADRTEQISPEKRIEKRLEQMTKELNLNATQQKEVRTLMMDAQKSQAAKKEERKKIMEQRKAQREIQRTAYENKMATILNAEQNAKWQKISAERAEKMKAKMKEAKETKPRAGKRQNAK